MKRNLFSILFVFLLVSVSGLHASTPNASNASKVGDVFYLSHLKQWDQIMEKAVKEEALPSAVCYVAYRGKVVYFKSFGYADRSSSKPLRNDAIFRNASQTKLVTTVALMTLYEKGLFRLEDPIKKYLPEFSKPVVYVSGNAAENNILTRPAVGDITIRQLLSHSSGIGYDSYGQELNGIRYPYLITTQEVVSRIAKLPLKHDPGKGFTYGFGLDVAGRLAEVISGMRLDSLIQERVLKPLEMKDTHFYLPEKKVNRLVSLYQKPDPSVPATLAVDSLDRFYPLAQNQLYFGGGAGLSGTIEDYSHLCQMILDHGVYNKKQILSKTTVEQMTVDQLFGAQGSYQFGLGLEIATPEDFARTMKSPGSLRWGGAYGTEYLIDPDKELVILLYTNKVAWNLKRDVWGDFLRAVYVSLR